MNIIAFYLIQLFQSGKIGKSQLKQIYKSNVWAQRILPLFYEMYIPESLWNYIMGSMKNIIDDILRTASLTENFAAHYRSMYTRHAFDIVTSKDVMMMMFAQEKLYPCVPINVQREKARFVVNKKAGFYCPNINNKRCQDSSGSQYNLRRMFFPYNPRKFQYPYNALFCDMVNHLETNLLKIPALDHSFNFHFFMATFMALMPNDFGKKFGIIIIL